MQITYGTTTLTLPDDMSWPDEFSWAAVVARREYSVTGALVMDQGTRLAGRPITLQAAANRAWASRATVRTLYAWAQIAGATLTLQWRGVTRTVAFDHEAGAIEGVPVIDEADPEDGDDYVLTLRFIEI